MLNQFASSDQPRSLKHLPNVSKGPSSTRDDDDFEHRDDIYSYYLIDDDDASDDDKEYCDPAVFNELNRVVHTKDDDLEAILEDGYDHFDNDQPGNIYN